MSFRVSLDRALFFTFLILFVAVTFYIFVIPQVNFIFAVRSQYIAQKQLLLRRQQKQAQLRDIENSLKNVETEFAAWQDRFLAPGELTVFWDELSRLLGKNSVLELLQPVSVSKDKENAPGDIYPALVDIELRTHFRQLQDILQSFKEHKRIIRVDYIKIEEGDIQGELSVDLRVSVYVDKTQPRQDEKT